MFKRSTSKLNWNLVVFVFVEGGKLENLEKNPLSKERSNNKLNPHETASMRMEPGSLRWEASAFPLVLPPPHFIVRVCLV